MSSTLNSPLSLGYVAEFDKADEQTWYQLLSEFEDANLYQTWAYASVIGGRRNISHFVLRKNGQVVAMAIVRTARIPLMKVGIAYVMWGPLWRRKDTTPDAETLRQAIRALHHEYVDQRRLVLRLFPLLFDDDTNANFCDLLGAEGFSLSRHHERSRTILMDLTPTMESLRSGMTPHWARELARVERRKCEVLEGSTDHLFEQFTVIYNEMVARKKFVEPNSIHQFRKMNALLPEKFKMNILLTKHESDICAGIVCSTIGNSSVLLFAATSNRGMKVGGSYLLQWRLVEQLKRMGLTTYNLNGINPAANPGTYQFKHGLAGKNGKDVYLLGRFDSCDGFLSRLCVEAGESLRRINRKISEKRRFLTPLRVWAKPAS